MSENTYVPRLQRELKAILKDPPPNIVALPLKKNILEWHYVITGPKGSPYEGGVYHGKIVFPTEYPMKPPSIFMITPSGRFETNKRLCLSMSDYHPETWNPLWSVSSILTGLLSFMLEETQTAGAIQTNFAEKRRLAAASWDFNQSNPQFKKLFPQFLQKPADFEHIFSPTNPINSSIAHAVNNAPVPNSTLGKVLLAFAIVVAVVAVVKFKLFKE